MRDEDRRVEHPRRRRLPGRWRSALALRRFRPDVAALCEFRATPPSVALAAALAEIGLRHQITTADPRRAGREQRARRLALSPRAREEPRAPSEPGRWLLARGRGADAIRARRDARAEPRDRAEVAVPRLGAGRGREWRDGPALFVGDTNSGRPGIDEEVPAFNRREGAWMEGLERAGWRDAFRHVRGSARGVHVVLAERRQWLPDRPGVREPGPAAATHPGEPRVGARAALRSRRPRARPSPV